MEGSSWVFCWKEQGRPWDLFQGGRLASRGLQDKGWCGLRAACGSSRTTAFCWYKQFQRPLSYLIQAHILCVCIRGHVYMCMNMCVTLAAHVFLTAPCAGCDRWGIAGLLRPLAQSTGPGRQTVGAHEASHHLFLVPSVNPTREPI